MTFEIAVYDAYCGLRKMNYTGLGAIRALRTLGVTLRAAKEAHDAFMKAEAWETAATR